MAIFKCICGKRWDTYSKHECPRCGRTVQDVETILIERAAVAAEREAGVASPPAGGGTRQRSFLFRDEPPFFEGLFDVTFRKFITRRVAGVVYGISLVLLLVLTPFVAYAAYEVMRGTCADDGYGNSYCTGAAPDWAWLGSILSVLIMFFWILMMRLQAERSVALVAIAQNTEPRHQLASGQADEMTQLS